MLHGIYAYDPTAYKNPFEAKGASKLFNVNTNTQGHTLKQLNGMMQTASALGSFTGSALKCVYVIDFSYFDRLDDTPQLIDEFVADMRTLDPAKVKGALLGMVETLQESGGATGNPEIYKHITTAIKYLAGLSVRDADKASLQEYLRTL